MSDLEKNQTDSDDNRIWRDDLPANFGPFKATDKPPAFEFSVQDLFQEIKDNLGADVFDIPFVGSGANHFVSTFFSSSFWFHVYTVSQGLHGRLVDGRDVMIRISRCD